MQKVRIFWATFGSYWPNLAQNVPGHEIFWAQISHKSNHFSPSNTIPPPSNTYLSLGKCHGPNQFSECPRSFKSNCYNTKTMHFRQLLLVLCFMKPKCIWGKKYFGFQWWINCKNLLWVMKCIVFEIQTFLHILWFWTGWIDILLRIWGSPVL